MLQEACEGGHILQKLDGGDVCPIGDWVCLLHLRDFNPKFTQALSGVIVPYGVCMVGEVKICGESSDVGSSLVCQTLDQKRVRIANSIQSK